MPNLLVIDDEPGIRRLVSSAMSKRGWTVNAAASAASGMLMARNTHPDVVLCDVVMPAAGAETVLRGLQDDPRNIPVLLMSGFPSDDLHLEHAVREWWRPVALLEKPFTVGMLEQALQYALNETSGCEALT